MAAEKIGNVKIELAADRRILNFGSIGQMQDAGIQIGKEKSVGEMDIFFVKNSGGKCVSAVPGALYLNDWAVEIDLHQ